MKRIGGLFEEFASFSNILAAYKKAREGARKNEERLEFSYNLEQELRQIREELLDGSYQPRSYRQFVIRDPKERVISVAPFRDRVVHHALVRVLEPVYERRFIFDSYATRKGKGAHAAVFRAQEFLRKCHWYYKTDIEKYFDSVDQQVLLDIIGQKIKDRGLMEVTARIIRNGGHNGKGLPIGNLTSQFFANVYLNPFDQFVKEKLGAHYYIRYMDDIVCFSQDKEQLKGWRAPISQYLGEKLKLRLKESATFFNNRDNGLSFLGARVFPNLIRIHPENLKRAIRNMRTRKWQYEQGQETYTRFLDSQNSHWAYLSVYDTLALRRQIVAKGF